MGNKDLAAFDKALKDVDTSVIPHYSVCFDEKNVNWEKNNTWSLLFLKNVENWANDFLLARGYIFLNDIYDRLGFDRTPAGQVVGWLNKGEGDNYVDFKIHDHTSDEQPHIQIDFNVDGIIIHKI